MVRLTAHDSDWDELVGKETDFSRYIPMAGHPGLLGGTSGLMEGGQQI